MKRLAFCAAVLVAALPLWPAAASTLSRHSSAQGVPINFNIVPGNQQPPKRYFTYAMNPGQSLNDTLAVINPGTAPLTVKLGVSDVHTKPQGAGITFNLSSKQYTVGRWLRVDNSTVTVAPNHVLFVGLHLNIPSSVRPGEYEGTINATNTQAQTITTGKTTIKIHGTVRCVVMLRVNGRASAGLRIAKTGVVLIGKQQVVGLTLQNTGTVTDRPTAAVITFTPSGPHKPFTIRPSIDTIMGGDSTVVAFALTQALAPGAYSVTVQLTYLAQLSPLAPAISLQSTWNGHLTVPSAAHK